MSEKTKCFDDPKHRYAVWPDQLCGSRRRALSLCSFTACCSTSICGAGNSPAVGHPPLHRCRSSGAWRHRDRAPSGCLRHGQCRHVKDVLDALAIDQVDLIATTAAAASRNLRCAQSGTDTDVDAHRLRYHDNWPPQPSSRSWRWRPPVACGHAQRHAVGQGHLPLARRARAGL